MSKRGPKSAEDLSGVAWIPGERAAPPADLSPEQQEVWRSIAEGMPDNWSRDVGTRILLKELCRTSVYARCLNNDAEAARTALAATPDNSRLRREWLALLRAFNLQAQRIADLATKLRLTRQSRQSARRGDQITSASSSRRPWTDWGLEDDSGDTKQ